MSSKICSLDCVFACRKSTLIMSIAIHVGEMEALTANGQEATLAFFIAQQLAFFAVLNSH